MTVWIKYNQFDVTNFFSNPTKFHAYTVCLTLKQLQTEVNPEDHGWFVKDSKDQLDIEICELYIYYWIFYFVLYMNYMWMNSICEL